jgi:tRNA-dihydrouridine synthase 2
MGSALLKKPDLIYDILTTLRRNLPFSLPLTCKIRLLEEDQNTIQLLQLIEKAGVAAVGIHARFVADRPRHQVST